MIEVSEYNPATGEIGLRMAFQNEKAFDLNRRDGFDYIDGLYDGADYYVADLAAIERPPQSTTLTGTVLSNMPIPATLLVDGARIEVDDGIAELELLLSGTYQLRVEAWPYKDWEGEVTV